MLEVRLYQGFYPEQGELLFLVPLLPLLLFAFVLLLG